MPIKKNIVATYKTSTLILSEEIELYRHDSGIDFLIDLRGFRYIFGENDEDEMVGYTGATKYTITIRKPLKGNNPPEYIKTPQNIIEDRKIKFTIDQSMTEEVGEYTSQIHLYNDNMDCMSMPPFTFLVKP